MLQQRTGNVVDILQVEEGIVRVRGDIERMEAEQKTLEHRVDFATIELQLTEEYKAQLNPPSASVSTRMNNAFVAGYHDASETVLGIVVDLIPIPTTASHLGAQSFVRGTFDLVSCTLPIQREEKPHKFGPRSVLRVPQLPRFLSSGSTAP